MTQAAAINGVSQPGISRSIRDLETRMRATLLRRNGRGVELTPAGIEFLAFAKSSLSAYEDAKSRVLEVSGNIPDSLHIAIPDRLGSVVYPVLYRQFMLELPEVAVAAAEALTADMIDGIAAGRVDMLISYLPTIPGSQGGKPAFRESLYLVERKIKTESADPTVSLADVAKQTFLLNHQGSAYHRLIDSAFSAAGHKLTVAREFETAESLLAFACEGEGVTILPYSNFRAEAQRGDVVGRLITDPGIERNIYVHTGRHLDNRTANLAREVVLRCLKEIAMSVRWSPI